MSANSLARMVTRRAFIQHTLTGGSVMAFGTVAPQLLCHAAIGARQRQRLLVVVEMAGGNDGLNTVIPAGDPKYREARPKLAIDRGRVLNVEGEIGLHPSLRGMADLLEQGKFAAVQGVGYPNPNRSHFESMDIWHSCLRKDEPRHDGWLGRYLEQVGEVSGGDPGALHLGHEPQPFAFMSRDVRVPSVQSLDQFRLNGTNREAIQETIEKLAGEPMPAANDLLGFVQSSASGAIRSSERMEVAAASYSPVEPFPGTALGKKMETVSRLIASGLQTVLYYVRIDGFDTHANQPDAHAALLREVGDAVKALVHDVDARGEGDRLLVMCFSEFGRRVAENASDGTDHGTAGPVLLAGNGVTPGLIGRHPSLADLQQGDLKHHIDFRSVYASVLEKWLQCPSESILKGSYPSLDLFA